MILKEREIWGSYWHQRMVHYLYLCIS